MSVYLVIFDDHFNAVEFMDNTGTNDISDHFPIDKYEIFINGEMEPIPSESYTIIPYAVIMLGEITKYSDLVDSYNGIIVDEFSLD